MLVTPNKKWLLQHHNTEHWGLLSADRDCAAMQSSNHIINFTKDVTILALNSKNYKSTLKKKVQQLKDWCRVNKLSLNMEK